MSDTWGKGAKNNTIGWGSASCTATNNWGKSQKDSSVSASWSGDTDISGCAGGVLSITYSASAFCEDGIDPTPTVSNNVGAGTFSSTTGLVFISTSTGEVDLSASTSGATYVITYTDTNSATATFSLTINDLDDASFAYSDSSYPQNFPDPTPTITGLAGGTFSGSTGLVIDSSTGVIDLDASTIASHTVTYDTTSSGSSVCPNTSTQNIDIIAELAQVNNVYSMSFDGASDYIDLGDSDDFSFGNGTTDSPFSISAWINMDDATRFRIASKFNSSSNNEYIFTTSASDLLALNLYDESLGGHIGRKYNTALTSYQGQWIHVACTYDGTSSSSGIKLYLNGSKVAAINSSSGSYDAMENTIQPLFIGQQAGTYANGKIDEVSIFNVELTAQDVQSIYLATEIVSGVSKTADLNDLTTPPIKWYRMGD